MTKRVAVVGRGVGARLHVPLLLERGDCRVDQALLTHLRPEHECQELAELDMPVDLLVLATPPFAHIPQVEALSPSCRLILCEKPAGLRSSDLSDLANRRPEAWARTRVNYQLRASPLVRELRARSDAFNALSIIYESDAGQIGSTPAWYHREELGGGVLSAIVSHLVDLVHFFGWTFERVCALTASEVRPGVEPGRFELVEIAAVGRDDQEISLRVDRTASHARFAIGVTSGPETSWYDLVTGRCVDRPVTHPSTDQDGIPTLSSRAPRPWRDSQRRLYDALWTGAATDEVADLADALRVHNVLDAIRSGIKAPGVWVTVGANHQRPHGERLK